MLPATIIASTRNMATTLAWAPRSIFAPGQGDGWGGEWKYAGTSMHGNDWRGEAVLAVDKAAFDSYGDKVDNSKFNSQTLLNPHLAYGASESGTTL